MIEVADFQLAPLQTWDDKLVDLSDVVEPVKAQFVSSALPNTYLYNNVTKKRGYYMLPMKIAAVPFHIWKSLVEKGGGKIADLPKTWDAFMDFFKPVQKGLRAAGMRNVYGYGLPADRQRRRPDQHLQRLHDRLWRPGPRHPGRQAP